MLRENLNGLVAFAAVARAGSFTRAAAQIGVSQPALSRTVRELEARLGVRLLARTTRSVSMTEAGERLLNGIGQRLDEIDAGVASLVELRERPAGTIRIAATEHAAETVLWPGLRRIAPEYPDITVEIDVGHGLTNGMQEGFDAGVRQGATVSKGMTAIPIGPPTRMAVVASPAYFRSRPQPTTPQNLIDHACINLRQPDGTFRAWRFQKDSREIKVSVTGQLVFDSTIFVMKAALDGFGIANVPADEAAPFVRRSKLIPVLQEWCPPPSRYHLYFPTGSRNSSALGVLIRALQWKIMDA